MNSKHETGLKWSMFYIFHFLPQSTNAAARLWMKRECSEIGKKYKIIEEWNRFSEKMLGQAVLLVIIIIRFYLSWCNLICFSLFSIVLFQQLVLSCRSINLKFDLAHRWPPRYKVQFYIRHSRNHRKFCNEKSLVYTLLQNE